METRSGNDRSGTKIFQRRDERSASTRPPQLRGKPPFSGQGPRREPIKLMPKSAPPPLPEIKITNDMQVTDGKHKGVQLMTTASPKIRPTARRIREAFFEALGKRVRFARFLDLCAGAGTVGIEAISRGAQLSTFVERSAKMCHYIGQNLEACKISLGHGEIVNLEAVPFLKHMESRKRVWDVVYYDPPYEADYDEVLQFFARGACLRQKGGVLIIEHHAEMFFPEKFGVLERRRVVREGETALTFYERGEENNEKNNF